MVESVKLFREVLVFVMVTAIVVACGARLGRWEASHGAAAPTASGGTISDVTLLSAGSGLIVSGPIDYVAPKTPSFAEQLRSAQLECFADGGTAFGYSIDALQPYIAESWCESEPASGHSGPGRRLFTRVLEVDEASSLSLLH